MNDETNKKLYTDLKVEKKEKSEVEITAEIPVAVAEEYRSKALAKITRDLELPGFRKGHVPEDMAVKHVGEAALLQETAEQALGDVYAQIVMDESLDVVGRPNVTITKLAPGNPIGFKISSAIYPELGLPDYKKVAEKEFKNHDDPDKVKVSDTDLDGELKRLQEMMTPKEAQKEEGEKNDTDTDTDEKKEEKKVAAPKVPELNDAFAQQLGDFKDLNDLKEKIKHGMGMEKKQKAHEIRRLAIADAIIAKTKVEVPGIFTEGELDQMFASFEEKVQRAGMEMDAYLEQAKKTKEDLRKEWRPDAEKTCKVTVGTC